jgi:hypothetical protein
MPLDHEARSQQLTLLAAHRRTRRYLDWNSLHLSLTFIDLTHTIRCANRHVPLCDAENAEKAKCLLAIGSLLYLMLENSSTECRQHLLQSRVCHALAFANCR